MPDNFAIALHALWRHKLRSILTMLGIIIGTGAIIAIVATIDGANEQIRRNLVGSGSNVVTVSLHEDNVPLDPGLYSLADTIAVPDEATRSRLLRESEIRDVSFYNERVSYDSVFYGNIPLSGGRLLGVDANYFDAAGLYVSRGRGFADEDFESFRKVALVDKTAVTSLFQGEDPVGHVIEVLGEPFTVVGIVSPRELFTPRIETVEDYYLYADRTAGAVYITRAAWPVISSFDEPVSAAIRAASADDMAIAGLKAAELLNSALGIPEGSLIKYGGLSLDETARELSELSRAAELQLVLIACISLLVGGIGVMNIMLVSVAERTREIGLRLALGAGPRRIFLQFLIEAVVLTTLGGVLGALSGYAFTLISARVTGAPIALDPSVAGLALLFSASVGLIFGSLPAVRASRLSPIEALRDI